MNAQQKLPQQLRSINGFNYKHYNHYNHCHYNHYNYNYNSEAVEEP